MAYDEKAKGSVRAHNVILEGREALSVSGVEDVSGFDEAEVQMQTVSGTLIVRGSELRITGLDLDTGEVSLQGLVTSLSYEEISPSRSLWAKLFH